MSTRLRVRPVEPGDEDLIERLLDDAEAKRRLGGLGGLAPVDRWLAFVLASTSHMAWLTFDGDDVIGLAIIETDVQGCVWPAVLVSRARRGAELGSASACLPAFALAQVDHGTARAEIETDNAPALGLARRIGFADCDRAATSGFVCLERTCGRR